MILSIGTLILNPDLCIDTVTDSAYKQVLIGSRTLGISFEPTTTVGDWNGQLTFGGIDSTKYTGTLSYT